MDTSNRLAKFQVLRDNQVSNRHSRIGAGYTAPAANHERCELSMATPDSTPLKRCSKCGAEKPATPEYFHASKRTGLQYYCKQCFNAVALEKKLKLSTNPETLINKRNLREQKKELEKEGKRYCRICDNILPLDCFPLIKGRYNGFICKECRADRETPNRQRPYKPRQTQDEKYRQCTKCGERKPINQYSPVGNGRLSSHCKACKSKQTALYLKMHPHVQHVHNARREARIKSLPIAFDHSEWQRALEYFNGCCAVCGRQLNDLFGEHTAAADHWIPLASSDCPGTIPTNIVPLCHGVGGCNNSKSNTQPYEWLVSKFGKRKAAEINARIQAYFDYVKSLTGGAS